MIFLLVHGKTGSGTPGRNIKNRQLQWARTLPLGGPPEPTGSRPCQRRRTLAIKSEGGKRNLGLPAGSRPKVRSAKQRRGQPKTMRHDRAAVSRTVSRSPPAKQTPHRADGQDTDHVSERRTPLQHFQPFDMRKLPLNNQPASAYKSQSCCMVHQTAAVSVVDRLFRVPAQYPGRANGPTRQ